jgi:6-phosphogluconolactonase
MAEGRASRKIVICPRAEQTADVGARRVAVLLASAVAARGRGRIALAGGRTPEALYRLLADPPYRDQIPWESVEVFWGDERCVPPDHAESNYRMAHEALLSRVPIPPGNVHRMAGEAGDPSAAAGDYEAVLHRACGIPPRLDVCLLGLGPDAHTASLFPGSPALEETPRSVAAVWVETFRAWRLTLTPPVLNAARYVIFLVCGADKAEALRAVLEGPAAPERYPAQIVRPPEGRVEWLLDREAARLLK